MDGPKKQPEKTATKNLDSLRRNTYPISTPSDPPTTQKKKSFLPNKPNQPTEDLRPLEVIQNLQKQNDSAKSVSKDDIPFGVIDEREELAYEAGFVNNIEKSDFSFTNKEKVFPVKSLFNNSIHSPDVERKSRTSSQDSQDVEMNPKYRSNTVQYQTEITIDEDSDSEHTFDNRNIADGGLIILGNDKGPLHRENKANKTNEKFDTLNFMKPTKSSKIKELDRPVAQKTEVFTPDMALKPKNFMKLNKKVPNVHSAQSLDKNEIVINDKEKIRDAYAKFDFEKLLRNDQLSKPEPDKLPSDESNYKKQVQQNLPRWQYTYKVDNLPKTSDDLNPNFLQTDVIDLNLRRSFNETSKANDKMTSTQNLVSAPVINRAELEDRNTILKFETLLTALKNEYDSLLAYCNDFAIRIEDTLYCYEEFYRRFNKLLQMIDEIKNYKNENRTSGNMNDLNKCESTINNFEIQTKEVIDMLEYLRIFPSSKIFYDKVISKDNKKFFLTFDKNITPNFPLNLLSVYSIKFLIELHNDFDFTLTAFCKKPLNYFQIFMHIKKFLNHLKAKIAMMLKTNQELKVTFDIVIEVTDFYFDFVESFKKNEDKCKEIVKRYSKFPIKKNFYDRANYAEFKKIKFNFNRDFS